MSKVLFVTSFNRELFEASGRALVESWAEHKPEGHLRAATEGVTAAELVGEDAVYHGLHHAPLESFAPLRRFERDNRDIIPRDLGGLARPCRCPNARNPHAKTHAAGCPNYWFNRHASRWFRKVCALTAALHADTGADVFAWLDADCVFLKPLPHAKVEEVLGGKDVAYLKSKDRQVIESGVMLFDLRRGGRRFIEDVFRRYTSGAFRRDKRWDDAYQFQQALGANRTITSVDMARRATGHADVLPNSPLGEYLEHRKGRHSRVLKLRK